MFHDDDAPRPDSRRGGIPWGSDEPPRIPPSDPPPPPVPEHARWTGMDILLGIAVLVAGYILLVFAFGVLAAIMGDDPVQDAFTVETAAILVVFEIWIGLAVLLIAKRRGITLAGLGFVMPRRWGVLPLTVVFCYLAIAAWALGIEAIDRYVDVDLGQLAEGNPLPTAEYDLAVWLLLGLGVVVLAPLSEELFFRGFLFRALDSMWPTFLAMVTSGFAFSLVHFNLSVLVPFTLIGIIFAWSFKSSQSLWTPIAAHAMVNGISFTLTVIGVEA